MATANERSANDYLAERAMQRELDEVKFRAFMRRTTAAQHESVSQCMARIRARETQQTRDQFRMLAFVCAPVCVAFIAFVATRIA